MKIALCTTTIHVPHALKLLRKCSADVMFFVTGDHKSPDNEIVALLEQCGSHMYLGYDRQGQRGWKCHDAIGQNTLARRNIAFLEALKWGADIIYSWDNDNTPIDVGHFQHLEFRLNYSGPFNGIQLGGHTWFDPGSLLVPPTRHRGFPYDIPHRARAEPVTDAKVGVAAGLVIGDPDIDAVTRMEHRPDIGSVHVLGSAGAVVDPQTWTVFNSQNTAVVRELIPAWFMMPGVGRHDDIYASLIVQRVARERGYHIHFGQPFTYQQRNQHNLIADLRAEIDGMENVVKMAALLDALTLPGKSVIADTRIIYETLLHSGLVPERSARAGLAWLEDCEGVI